VSQPSDLVSGECRPWDDLDKHDALTTAGMGKSRPNLRWLEQDIAYLIKLTTSQRTCTQMQQTQFINLHADLSSELHTPHDGMQRHCHTDQRAESGDQYKTDAMAMLMSSVSHYSYRNWMTFTRLCLTCEERCCRSLNLAANSVLYHGLHGCTV